MGYRRMGEIREQWFDFDHAYSVATARGPFRNAVRTTRVGGRRRVSRTLRRKMILMLHAWARTTTAPRDRLRIIRRRRL
jgi:hypothetical protein